MFRVLVRVKARVSLELQTVFRLWLGCGLGLCSMHTYRLAVGSWRYRQLPTENRRSSVGVYQTTTRSSALIGAIPPIQNLNRR